MGMSHDCNPNAIWSLDDSGRFVLRARSHVSIGDEVTISYLSEPLLLSSSPERQRILQSTKGFLCRCPRCRPGSCDLSRGFQCQRLVCPGTVFCRVPSAPNDCWISRRRLRSKSKLNSMYVDAFAACQDCNWRVDESQAANFFSEERWLVTTLDGWEAASPRGRISRAEVMEYVQRIRGTFKQHVVADHAFGHLVAALLGLDCHEDAAALMAQRVEFQRAAFPGHSALFAWTSISLADMRLRLAGLDLAELATKADEKKLAPGKVKAVPDEVSNDARCRYSEAMTILKVLFGANHREYVQTARKLAA